MTLENRYYIPLSIRETCVCIALVGTEERLYTMSYVLLLIMILCSLA